MYIEYIYIYTQHKSLFTLHWHSGWQSIPMHFPFQKVHCTSFATSWNGFARCVSLIVFIVILTWDQPTTISFNCIIPELEYQPIYRFFLGTARFIQQTSGGYPVDLREWWSLIFRHQQSWGWSPFGSGYPAVLTDIPGVYPKLLWWNREVIYHWLGSRIPSKKSPTVGPTFHRLRKKPWVS